MNIITTLQRVLQTLTVPAAEYVPAIGDAIGLLQDAEKTVQARLVLFCSECGHIGGVEPPAIACCPDNKGEWVTAATARLARHAFLQSISGKPFLHIVTDMTLRPRIELMVKKPDGTTTYATDAPGPQLPLAWERELNLWEIRNRGKSA
jgi:hypothetical protein